MVEYLAFGVVVFGIFITLAYPRVIKLFIVSQRLKHKRKSKDPLKKKKKKRRIIEFTDKLLGIDLSIASLALICPFEFRPDPKIKILSANKIGSIIFKKVTIIKIIPEEIDPNFLFAVNFVYFLFFLVPAIGYFCTEKFEIDTGTTGRKAQLISSWLLLSFFTWLSISILFVTIIFVSGTPQR